MMRTHVARIRARMEAYAKMKTKAINAHAFMALRVLIVKIRFIVNINLNSYIIETKFN